MMDYLESLTSNLIYLLFPLAIYLLYIVHKRNLNHQEHKLCLELALLSSLYLILRKGFFIDDYTPLVLCNVPLLISYLKKNTSLASAISLVLILYSIAVLQFPISITIFEYGLYFAIYTYLLNLKKKATLESVLSIFIIVKSFILSIETFLFINPTGTFIENILYLFIISFVLYGVSYLVLYFLKRGEEIIDLNSIIYQLEKEKNLRKSIFQITHEIKNPIAVCKGYLDMLDVNDIKKVRKYIPIIKDEISRTLTLMDDFLSYSKLKIEKEEVDMYFLIEEVIDTLKPLFKKNHILLKSHLPDKEFYLEVDYQRIKQVLVNLLKNAVEAKDKEKMEIIIKTKITQEVFEIQIKDNGEGMDEETMKKLGEMFYTTKQKGSGIGVGLSKEIMRLHGGDLYYESKKGKGTTAFLLFPIIENKDNM